MLFFSRRFMFVSVLILSTLLISEARGNSINVRTPRSQAIKGLKHYRNDKRLQDNLDLISRSTLSDGNQAQILLSGIMSLPVRIALLDQAQSSIIISIYSINRLSKGRRAPSTEMLVQKLSAALSRGVKVYILIDGFTSPLTGIEPNLIKLISEGARVERYQPINSSMDSSFLVTLFEAVMRHMKNPITVNRLHEKLLLVDGKYALIGGMNWGENYFAGDQYTALNYTTDYLSHSPLLRELGVKLDPTWGPTSKDGWRDTDLLLKGSVLNAIKTDFIKRWIDNLPAEDHSSAESKTHSKLLYENLVHDVPNLLPVAPKKSNPNTLSIRYISQQPQQEWYLKPELKKQFKKDSILPYLRQCPQANISNFYLGSIRSAKRQVLWGGHAIGPIFRMSEELIAAAARGVQVYLITNSKETAKGLPDGGTMFYRRAACWSRYLLENSNGNLRVFEWQSGNKNKTYQVGPYHSKTFTVDGYISSIGSYNIAPGSYCAYTENTAVIANVDFTSKIEKAFEKDLLNTKEMKLEDFKDLNCEQVRQLGHWLFTAGYIKRTFIQRLKNLWPSNSNQGDLKNTSD